MSSDAAAWVQAIGSIAAVASGFAYHAWQINLGLRRRLRTSIDALEYARAEIHSAATNGWSLAFDTSRLHMLIDVLESPQNGALGSLDDELAVNSAVVMLRRYAAAWDASHESVRTTIESVMDGMDVDGEFQSAASEARDALSKSLRRLARNPFLTY